MSNGTGDPVTLKLYAGDATIDKGSWQPADPGAEAGEIASWTTVSPSSLTLAPRTRGAAEVTIAVPRQAGDGERYGVVWAELPAATGGAGVAEAARVGIRIYLSVGTGQEPASDFTVDSLTAGKTQDGRPFVQARVHNTGGRALDMSGTLELRDGPGGLSAGPFPAELGTTLGIGQTEPVLVLLDKALPAGPWHARIDLQSGRIKRAAEATITFPALDGTTAEAVAAVPLPLTARRSVVIPVAIAILGLVALWLLFFLWKRRRRDAEQPA